MFSKVNSIGLRGLEGYPVSVEVDAGDGLPGITMVGVLASEVREAQDRVRTALKNSGYHFRPQKVTVNLSPADIRKAGTGFDFPIAVGMLEAMELVPAGAAEGLLFLGELGLNGELKKARGVLPIVRAAAAEGIRECIVPGANAREGGVIPGIRVRGAENILEIMHFLMARGEERDRVLPRTFVDTESLFAETERDGGLQGRPDFAEVTGQETARRAAEAVEHGLLAKQIFVTTFYSREQRAK